MLPFALLVALAQVDLSAPDPAARLVAVQQVERLGADAPDAAHLVPLAALLADADERTRGLAALAVTRHVAACPDPAPQELVGPLLVGMRDGNRHVAAFCARAFTALGVRAIPALAVTRDQRSAAVSGLARLMAEPGCRDRVGAVLWTLLDDPAPQVRERALRLLVHLRADHALPPSRYLPRLGRLFAEHGPAGELAAGALLDLGSDALGAVLDLAQSERPDLRAAARDLLVRLHLAGAVPTPRQAGTLLVLFQGSAEVDQVRGSLARMILTHRPDLAPTVRLDLVLEALLDNPDVPEELVRRLRDPGERADLLRDLVARLARSDPARQRVLADLLHWFYRTGDAATPAALEALAALARSPVVETRRAALRTFSHAARPTLALTPQALAAVARTLGHHDRLVRIHAAYALAACGQQAERLLHDLLVFGTALERQHAADAVTFMVHLHQVVPRTVLPALEKLADDSSTELAIAVRQAAGSIRLARPDKGAKP